MQSSRYQHCLLAQGNVIVETNHLNQVRITSFLVVFKILLYYLLEPINNELLHKWWIRFLGFWKLFICFVLVFSSLKMEKRKTKSEFSTFRILLNSHPVHSFKLFQELNAIVLHLVLPVFFLFFQILRKWTIFFSTDFLVLLNVSYQKHVTVLIFLLVFNQLKNVSNVTFKLLATSKLKVRSKKFTNIWLSLKKNDNEQKG